MIDVTHLTRVYHVRTGIGRRRRMTVEAIRDVSFLVNEGELFGLLGPNGAGKSSTIKILSTLLLPTSGTARIANLDVVESAPLVRSKIGFVLGGDRGFFDRLSATDNLRYFAELYDVTGRAQRQRIAEVIDVVGLRGREDQRVEGFSRGMRQRLHIARGLIHNPQVLFLDEPSIGLDPIGARDLRATIQKVVADGMTVLLTTHHMVEAEALCSRLAVINHGEIVAEGSPDALKRHVVGRCITEVLAVGVTQTEIDRALHRPEISAAGLEEIGAMQMITLQSLHPLGAKLVEDIVAPGDVRRITAREPTLEDAYIALISSPGPTDQLPG